MSEMQRTTRAAAIIAGVIILALLAGRMVSRLVLELEPDDTTSVTEFYACIAEHTDPRDTPDQRAYVTDVCRTSIERNN